MKCYNAGEIWLHRVTDLRVIAGSARGRRFETLPGLATRPTLDRVKESVFGSLQFDLPGSRVLDLQPGVWKAFGFSSCNAWGLRTVSYRFL